MGDRTTFLRTDREVPRSERDRERDLRSERERDRDIRSERDRDRDRERHDQQPMFSRQFQSNLPPRFQKQQAERHQFLRGGSGGPSSSPQPLSGTGSSSQGSQSSQVPSASQGPPSAQMFDPRWSGPSTHGSSVHFPGSLPCK